MNKSYYLAIILNCLLLVSCNTEQPPIIPQNNQNQNENNINSNEHSTNTNSNNQSNDIYYFELEQPCQREISLEAKSIDIFFKCNQEYSISSTGNITGIRLSQTSGKGDGYVTVSFDKVQYRIDAAHITWNEYGYIIFNVKEGPKKDYKIVEKKYYLVRRGIKMNV